MTAFDLKIIAIVTMTIDHIGAFLFPGEYVYRIIGRISFPLFAFLIANGAQHTKDLRKYILRIFLFALISQLPFLIATRSVIPEFYGLNVLFTFLLALIAIYFLQKSINNIYKIVIITLTSGAAYFLETDYGAFGVLLTIVLYLLYKRVAFSITAFIILVIIFSILPAVKSDGIDMNVINWGRMLSIPALILISLYNFQQGLKTKYLFYVFYPLHLMIIYLIKLFVLK